MNQTNPRLMRPPPPREIQAHFGSKGRTPDTPQASLTSDRSDASSVVSEVTLDAAFDKDHSTKQQSDICFHNNVVVVKSPIRRTTGTISTIAKQESLSKLDGSDFLKGKFKCAFHKDIKISLKSDENESQGKMSEEKQAIEQLNHHRQISEGVNSVLDMFTSPNLVEKKKERHKSRNSTDRKKNKNAHDEDSRARLPRIDEFNMDRAKEAPAKEISIHPEDRDPTKESPNKGRPAKQHGLPQQMPRRDNGDIPKSITISDEVIDDIDLCGLDLMDFIEEQVQAVKEADQNPVDAEVKEADQNRVDSSSRRCESSLQKEQKTTRSKTASPTRRRRTTPSRNQREFSASPTRRRRISSRDLRRSRSEVSASPTRRRRTSSSPSRKSRRDRSAPTSRTRRKSAAASFVPSSTQKKSSSKIENREKKSSHSSKDGSYALSKSGTSESSKSRRLESIKRESDNSHLFEIKEKDQVITKRSMEKQGPSTKKNRLKTMEQDPEFEEIPGDSHMKVSPEQVPNVKRLNNRLLMTKKDSEFKEIMRVAIGSFPLQNSSSAPDLALLNAPGNPEKNHDLSPTAASVNAADTRATPMRALMKRMSWRNGRNSGGLFRPTPLSEENADLSGSKFMSSASTFTSSTSDVSWLQGSRGMRSHASSWNSIVSQLSSELSSKSCGSSGRSFTESPGNGGANMPRRIKGECASPVVTAPKTMRQYTPTVITNGSKSNLSYSERVLQGQIGMPVTRAVLKPTPEGSTLCEF